MNGTLELPADPLLSSAQLDALAEEAVVWGFPLVQVGRYLDKIRTDGLPFNHLLMNTRLATPDLDVVGPNIDTLYGLAWIDVSQEPQVLSVPRIEGRYYSFQLCDAYEETFAYVGSRSTGTSAGAFAITAPGWRGELPAGVVQIKAPTDIVLAVARTHVRGDDDLEDARAVHTSYRLGQLSAYPEGQIAAVSKDGALALLPEVDLSNAGIDFFDELCALLTLYPPASAKQMARMDRFAAVGISPGSKPSANAHFAPRLEKALPPALSRIAEANFFFVEEDGWRTNKMLTDFGIDDPLVRAAVNFLGPAFHLATEAIYYNTRMDSEGEVLTGEKCYTLSFAPGDFPPVNDFWSLGMYSDKFQLVPNAIDRYSIHPLTSGLRYSDDGSLAIVIQHNSPADSANWLPAPQGPFMLFFRAYAPRQPMRDGSYRLPLPATIRMTNPND